MKYCFEGSCGGYPLEEIFTPDEEDPPVKCELCDNDATCKLDIDPLRNPGRFIADLCEKCYVFENKRINIEIKNMKP